MTLWRLLDSLALWLLSLTTRKLYGDDVASETSEDARKRGRVRLGKVVRT